MNCCEKCFEDKVLIEELGPNYAKYYARSWDFIDLFIPKLKP